MRAMTMVPFLVVTIASAVAMSVVPCQVYLLTGLAFVLAAVMSRKTNEAAPNLFAMLVLIVVVAALGFGWRLWLLAPHGLAKWSAPMGLLGLLWLVWAERRAGKPMPHASGRLALGVQMGFVVLALIAIGAAIAVHWMGVQGASKGIDSLLGAAVGAEVYRFPAWLGGSNQNLLAGYALSAVTLCVGAFLVTRARVGGLLAGLSRHSRWTTAIAIGLGALMIGLLAALLIGHSAIMKNRACDPDLPSQVFWNSVNAALAQAEAAERLSVRSLSRDAYQTAFERARCHDESGAVAYSASKLIGLGSEKTSHSLALGMSLDAAGLQGALHDLFSPRRIPDEALAAYRPESPAQALFLAKVWKDRNKIKPVRDVLTPWVALLSKRCDTNERAEPPSFTPFERDLLLLFGDYSLYAEDRGQALTVAECLLLNDPRDPHALTIKGTVHYDRDEIKQAFESFYKAYVIDSSNVRYAGNLTSVYLLMNDERAAVNLQKYLLYEFPGRAWRGPQGPFLEKPGSAFLQGEFSRGKWRMEVVAKGYYADGNWPEMELWVNGELQGKALVESDIPKRYGFEFTARRGPNRIELRYAGKEESVEDEPRFLHVGPGFFKPIYYPNQKR